MEGVTSVHTTYNDGGIEYYGTQCVSKLNSNKAEIHSENEKNRKNNFFLTRKISPLFSLYGFIRFRTFISDFGADFIIFHHF